MAKRRKVSAPSADDLNQFEEEFRRETPNTARGGLAPIAQVASEAAQAASQMDADARAVQEGQRVDAATLAEARGQGRVLEAIPLAHILADAVVRDRLALDAQEMTELKISIAAHGVRLPVEVFRRDDPEQPYGLISGYRRLMAVRELAALTGNAKYDTINAVICDPETLGGSFAAMVEENEVRSGLSHYERGRIAVVAAQQGVYASTEDAVAALFNVASKAKRSKIRSFSLIFEELGDMLEYPETLRERDGLRLSTVLRQGAEGALREALAQADAASPEEEWDAMAPVIVTYESRNTGEARGGRPKTRKAPRTGWTADNTLRLSSGVVLQSGSDADGFVIRLKGQEVNSVLVERAMEHLQYLFEKD